MRAPPSPVRLTRLGIRLRGSSSRLVDRRPRVVRTRTDQVRAQKPRKTSRKCRRVAVLPPIPPCRPVLGRGLDGHHLQRGVGGLDARVPGLRSRGCLALEVLRRCFSGERCSTASAWAKSARRPSSRRAAARSAPSQNRGAVRGRQVDEHRPLLDGSSARRARKTAMIGRGRTPRRGRRGESSGTGGAEYCKLWRAISQDAGPRASMPMSRAARTRVSNCQIRISTGPPCAGAAPPASVAEESNRHASGPVSNRGRMTMPPFQ